jgi:hypothetical protein
METADGDSLSNSDGGAPFLGLYTAAKATDRRQTLKMLRRTVGRLAYFDVIDATSEGEEAEMVKMRLRAKPKSVALEMMKADLRMLWQLEVAQSSDAIFQVVDTRSGFDFRFALLHANGDFVSGAVAVDLFESHVGLAA